MPVIIQKTDKELTVEFEGAVTIWDAHDVASQLSEQLNSEPFPISLSASVKTARLLDIHSSVLQVLCSLRKTVASLSFENPSAEFIAAVDRCGLRRELLGWIREAA